MAGDNYIKDLHEVRVKNRCWNAYMTSSLRDLYNKAELCDTILTLPTSKAKTLLESELLVNKYIFPVHKCVVGAVSPFLKSLFKDEPTCNEYCIPTVTGRALGYVLDFIYSGESDIPLSQVDDVFCAAIVLQVESMSFQLKKTISKPVSYWEKLKRNALNAMYYNDPSLKKRKHYESSEENDITFECEASGIADSNHSSENNKDISCELMQHNQPEDPSLRQQDSPRLSEDETSFPVHSQPVFPGQEESAGLPDEIHNNGEETPPDTDKVLKDTSEDKSIKDEKEWLKYQPPIVIEPSMAYSLFELAQRHRPAAVEEEEARYGITAQPLPTLQPSHNADPPSASSVLRSLLKQQEANSAHAAEQPESASSTLLAMLKNKSNWNAGPSFSPPTAPQLSQNRLKAMLEPGPLGPPSECEPARPAERKASTDARSKIRNWTEDKEKNTEAEENRKRLVPVSGAGSELLQILKRQKITPPVPRSMPAALKPVRKTAVAINVMTDRSFAKKGEETVLQNEVAGDIRRKQRSAVVKEGEIYQAEVNGISDGEVGIVTNIKKENVGNKDVHHPILFSILKEQNLKQKGVEECENEEQEERKLHEQLESARKTEMNEKLTTDLDKVPLRRYTQEQMNAAVDLVIHQGCTEKEAAGIYGIPVCSLKYRLKNPPDPNRVIGHQPLFSESQELEICDRINQRINKGMSAERTDILRIAHEFAVSIGKRDDQHPLSRKWYYGFMKRMQKINQNRNFVMLEREMDVEDEEC